MDATSGNWKLIPRWHPKVAELPDPENGNQPYKETWDALVESLGEYVVRVDGPPTDSVVVASDLVVAGFSTLLTTAAKAGVATAPTDLALLESCSQEARARLKPFDAVLGAAAVHALLEGR